MIDAADRIRLEQFLFVGHGANQPVVSHAPPAGNARDRRVEIVVYPQSD